MCDAMRSLESNQQPRFLASGTGWISESPTRILILSSFFSCCDEPMMRNSVLSPLNLRSLFNIQERMSPMQSSIFLTTASYSAKWDVNLWIICATVNHLLKGIRFSHHCHFPPPPPSYSLSISDISASLSSKYGTFRSIPTCLMTSSRGMYWVAIFSWQELKPVGNFVQGSEKIHSFQTEIHSDWRLKCTMGKFYILDLRERFSWTQEP